MKTAHATIENKTGNWCTPHKIAKLVKEFFNEISLDPCSNNYSIIDAKTKWTKQDSGLLLNWHNYETIYVNPPYGRDKTAKTSISNWLEKCADAFYFGSEILALIPVSTNTGHWKKFVWPVATAICFLSDTRLKFTLNGEIQQKGAPMACCIVYYGDKLKKFCDVFKTSGAIIYLKALNMSNSSK